MSTSTFQQQDAFQAERMKFVGGSDVGNLYDLPPYFCQRRLAYKKTTSIIPDFPFTGSSATDRGNRYERFAADLYSEKTGRDIRKAHPKADDVVPVLRPQPDFEIVNDARGPERGRGILSIKVPGRESFIRLKAALEWMTGREAKTDWEKQARDSGLAILQPYLLQGYAECAAQKTKWFSFGFVWMDGEELAYADVDTDTEIVEDIRARARAFWDTFTANGLDGFVRLDPKSKQCGKCEYRVTCQQANLLKLLEAANKDVEGTRQVAVIPQIDVAVRTLWERQDLEDEAHALVDEAKENIRAIMADCDAAEGFEARAYNSLRAGRQTVQKDQLLKFIREFAARAQELVERANAAELNVTEFFKALEPVLGEAAKLNEVIEAKFINRGKPYRELRVYALPKKKDGKP